MCTQPLPVYISPVKNAKELHQCTRAGVSGHSCGKRLFPQSSYSLIRSCSVATRKACCDVSAKLLMIGTEIELLLKAVRACQRQRQGQASQARSQVTGLPVGRLMRPLAQVSDSSAVIKHVNGYARGIVSPVPVSRSNDHFRIGRLRQQRIKMARMIAVVEHQEPRVRAAFNMIACRLNQVCAIIFREIKCCCYHFKDRTSVSFSHIDPDCEVERVLVIIEIFGREL